MRSTHLALLILLLVVKGALMLGSMPFLGIGLGPDEAQYWTWSRDLAWGYYSKPPGIAWQIWLGCLAFGQTELGVRLLAVVMGASLALSVYTLARCCGLDRKVALWSGVVMALTPLGIMGSFLAITDGGMVLFWTLGCCVIAKGLLQQNTPSYDLLGLCILVGALFKWPIYLLWVAVIVAIPFWRFLASWSLLRGIAISLAGLLPSVIWNSSHDWVTFRHVSATVVGKEAADIGSTTLAHGNFWSFLGAQMVLISPILFVLMVIALAMLWKRRREVAAPLIFCGTLTTLLVGTFLIVSFFEKMQGNWCDYAYPTGIVVLCWGMQRRLSWVIGGLALSVFLCKLGFAIPYIQSNSILANAPIPYRVNPFRHNVGWNELKHQLKEVGYNPEKHFLFGDKYQMSSILSFYGEGQKRAYFLNLHGIRKNQFSFWPGMAQEQVGKTGFFILTENAPHLKEALQGKAEEYQNLLAVYFDKVEFLGVKTLFYSYGESVKEALIFRCEGYNGKEPPSPEIY